MSNDFSRLALTAAPEPRPKRASPIERATLDDVAALLRLEQSAFTGDRISRRSWRHLIGSRSASVTVVRGASRPAAMVDTQAETPADTLADTLAGAAVVLRAARSSIARLYSIAVSESARGQGLAGRLLADAIERAQAGGAAVFRLETRIDNHAAQALFERHGFTLRDSLPGYYEDGATALRFQKSLWDVTHSGSDIALRAPYYAQTLDFTCGPCALLMAMAALDATTVPDRAAEIRLWREATTVFMAAGHGGCGPFGLALAALRRGFQATVYAPAGQPMFIDSVRDPRKKDVIALVEADFRAELATTRATLLSSAVTPQRIAEHLHAGGVPLVLISLWRLHGEMGPHWVVVTGFDGHVFRILDPIAPPPSNAAGDPGLAVSLAEFKRITRYGRRRQTAAVIISKGP